jgi:hypothetical protein
MGRQLHLSNSALTAGKAYQSSSNRGYVRSVRNGSPDGIRSSPLHGGQISPVETPSGVAWYMGDSFPPQLCYFADRKGCSHDSANGDRKVVGVMSLFAMNEQSS